MRNAVFESETVPFQPGGVLVLYTDGLIETPRPPDTIFTPNSLRQFLNACSGGSAAEISSKITSAQFFDPSIEMEDDLTLIVARHTGEGTGSSLNFEI
jgi:serine phosphatase RsbU (regulator of sigma subunit)